MGEFLNVVLTFAPLILILWLANLGQRLRERDLPFMPPVVISYSLLALLYMFCALGGFVALLASFAVRTRPEAIQQFAIAGQNPLDLVESWEWLSWGILIPSLLGLLLLTKPLRRLVARFTSIDPGHPVHAVALSMTMLPFVGQGMTLGIGLGNLATQLTKQAAETGVAPVSLVGLWGQTAMFLLMALIGVGWLSRRSFGQVLVRLGIVKPTVREVVTGVVVAFLLVPLVMMLEAGMNALGLGVGQDVEKLTENLVGPLFATPFGVISIGLAAAIGEEPIFRGALQVRFGIVITAVLFAFVHSQYGISLATLIVFVLGLVLGWERKKYNTTTSIITHALYNSTLGVLAYLAAQMLGQKP